MHGEPRAAGGVEGPKGRSLALPDPVGRALFGGGGFQGARCNDLVGAFRRDLNGHLA